MTDALASALAELTDIQRQAVEWNDGALLVLAGPRSGRTRVLTCRVARLLDSSRDRRFRILALTSTNKAAHEMARRVTEFVPGLEERTAIATFHGFCARVLRQHGAHLGIKSDFTIYSRESDRQAVLEDALRRGRPAFSREDRRLLPLIDQLKARLVDVGAAQQRLAGWNGMSHEEAGRVARAYRLYEDELRHANGLDFNSLILKACELFGHPAIAWHYQTVYRYWLIDEFQDTNDAQYALLKRMAGDFRRIFAVADDDQTIYEWNGANVRRIRQFAEDFSSQLVQLPTNFHCPPSIVEAANCLVVYNARRATSKRPMQPHSVAGEANIECREFPTDAEETDEIAAEIAGMDLTNRGRTVVLARSQGLLYAMLEALEAKHVEATILTHRDDFVSPRMRWLIACLRQINRPLDRRNLATVVETFVRFAELPPAFDGFDADEIVSRATADGFDYLSLWTDAVRVAKPASPADKAVAAIADLARGNIRLRQAIEQILGYFKSAAEDESLEEDLSAWRRLSGEIETAGGLSSLDRFLQILDLGSKEPALAPGAVSLATIHGAKGLEFDAVYVIGLAEEVLPSWHSVRKGDGSPAIEEERRGCFVAITRPKRRLILSWARKYKGWPKAPSRFLREMGVLNGGAGP